MHAQQIISTHPEVRGSTNDVLIQCVEACFDCGQACTACADACLAEDPAIELRQCVRLNLDCADVCLATGTLASRRTGSNEPLLETMLGACTEACRPCGEECAKHADAHQHCRICAEACRQCGRACAESAESVTSRRQ